MSECRDCGTEFYNEAEPLSVICDECRDSRDNYYADWLKDRADDAAWAAWEADDFQDFLNERK